MIGERNGKPERARSSAVGLWNFPSCAASGREHSGLGPLPELPAGCRAPRSDVLDRRHSSRRGEDADRGARCSRAQAWGQAAVARCTRVCPYRKIRGAF